MANIFLWPPVWYKLPFLYILWCWLQDSIEKRETSNFWMNSWMLWKVQDCRWWPQTGKFHEKDWWAPIPNQRHHICLEINSSNGATLSSLDCEPSLHSTEGKMVQSWRLVKYRVRQWFANILEYFSKWIFKALKYNIHGILIKEKLKINAFPTLTFNLVSFFLDHCLKPRTEGEAGADYIFPWNLVSSTVNGWL